MGKSYRDKKNYEKKATDDNDDDDDEKYFKKSDKKSENKKANKRQEISIDEQIEILTYNPTQTDIPNT